MLANLERNKLIVIAGSIITFILLATGTGGNAWFVHKTDSGYTIGLWKQCNPIHCLSFTATAMGDAVRAFAIISVLAAVGGIVFAVFYTIKDGIPGKYVGVVLVGAAACMFATAILFVTRIHKPYGWTYGWSFYISLAGALVGVFTGLFAKYSERFMSGSSDTTTAPSSNPV